MLIELDKLSDTPVPIKEVFGEIDLEDASARLLGDAALNATARRVGEITDISGRIACFAELDCSRCLVPVEREFDFEFHAAYKVSDEGTGENEIKLTERDLDVAFCPDGNVDAAELTREQILLALPERIYCREDCQGLCPKCGINKNLERCDCIEKDIDPRWSALAKFKK
jgi:uncharacterized protein